MHGKLQGSASRIEGLVISRVPPASSVRNLTSASPRCDGTQRVVAHWKYRIDVVDKQYIPYISWVFSLMSTGCSVAFLFYLHISFPSLLEMDHVTDGFSPIGVTALALTTQNRAFAVAEELAQHDDTPELANTLNPLAAQIELLGQLSTALHLALDNRPPMTPRLQGCLHQYLNTCDPHLAALTKQLMRLQPETLHDINWHFFKNQQALLKSYNDLFAYLEEILRV